MCHVDRSTTLALARLTFRTLFARLIVRPAASDGQLGAI